MCILPVNNTFNIQNRPILFCDQIVTSRAILWHLRNRQSDYGQYNHDILQLLEITGGTRMEPREQFSCLSYIFLVPQSTNSSWDTKFFPSLTPVYTVADPGFPPGGGENPLGEWTHNFAKFSQKLHEIERIWTPDRRGGACVQNFTM